MADKKVAKAAKVAKVAGKLAGSDSKPGVENKVLAKVKKMGKKY